MVEPILTISLIIGMIAATVGSIGGIITIIIKFKDITEWAEEWIVRINRRTILIRRYTLYGMPDRVFVGFCHFLHENQTKLNCSNWQTVDFNINILNIPESGRFLQITLNNREFGIRVFSDDNNPRSSVSGFKIYYDNLEDYGLLLQTATCKFVPPDILEHYRNSLGIKVKTA